MLLSNLPNEILLGITDNLGQEDLNSFLKTSKSFADLLTPQLHKFALLDRPGPWLGSDSPLLPPLCWAAWRGHEPLVRLLLEKGTNIHELDYPGQTALHYAAREGHLEVARILLSNGAEIDFRCKNRYTPLHCATLGRQETLVKFLLENGADPVSLDRYSRTPLREATSYPPYWSEPILRVDDDTFEVSMSEKEIAAVMDATVGLVSILLEHGASAADINTPNARGTTLVHWVVCDDYSTRVLEILVEKGGGDVHIADKDGNTPLHWAAARGSVENIKYLLGRGVDIDILNSNQQTPLHIASQFTSCAPELLAFFLDNGAKADALDLSGKTALHYLADYCLDSDSFSFLHANSAFKGAIVHKMANGEIKIFME